MIKPHMREILVERQKSGWAPQKGDFIYVGSHETQEGRVLGGLAMVIRCVHVPRDLMVEVEGRSGIMYSWKELGSRQIGLGVEFGRSKAMAAIPKLGVNDLQLRRKDTFEMSLF